MQRELKRLFRHSAIYLIGNLLNRLGAFLLLPLYTSYLSVAEYGRLEILYSFSTMVSVVCGAALSHASLRFYFDGEDERARRRVIATGLVSVFAFAVTAASLIYAVRVPIAEALLDSAAYVPALTLCLAIMVIELTTEVGFAYLRAREKSVFYVAIAFVRLLVQVALSIYLVKVAGLGMMGVLEANALSCAVVAAAVLGYTLRQCGITVELTQLKAMLRYSLPMALSAILAAVTANLDRFLIKYFVSVAAVGLYGLATKFALLVSFVVLEPFSRSFGAFRFSVMNREDAPAIQAQATHYLFVVAALVAVAVAAFTPEVLHLMADPSYTDAYRMVPLLLVGVVANGVSYSFETGILYRKRTSLLFYGQVAFLIVETALMLAFIPLFGPVGAALAVALSHVAFAVMVNRMSHRLYPVPYRYLPMLRIGAIVAVFYLVSLALDFRDPRYSIPLKCILGFVLLALVYAVDAEVRSAVRSLHLAWRSRVAGLAGRAADSGG